MSVIVPIFNTEKYLQECLESVTRQTLQEIQIILVNDGSTDSSGEICKRYAKNDARVLYIEKPNGGLASARRSGLEHATGQHIGFVDSDDWVEPHMYERMHSVAEEHTADVVLCDSIFNGKKNRSAHLKAGYYDSGRIAAEIFPHTLASFNTDKLNERIRWSNCVRLYRKRMLDEFNISFDDRFRRCQDLPFSFESTLRANSIYYLGDEYLYHNRPVVDSLSKGYTVGMWALLKPLMQYLDEVVDSYPSYDFSSQMTLRAFMFAVNCIENEAKPGNNRTLPKRLHTLREIMQDEYTRKIVVKLDSSSFSRLYASYYRAFKYRLVFIGYLIAYYRLRNLRRRHRASATPVSRPEPARRESEL